MVSWIGIGLCILEWEHLQKGYLLEEGNDRESRVGMLIDDTLEGVLLLLENKCTSLQYASNTAQTSSTTKTNNSSLKRIVYSNEAEVAQTTRTTQPGHSTQNHGTSFYILP